MLHQLVSAQKETNQTLRELADKFSERMTAGEVRFQKIEDNIELLEQACEWKHKNGRRRSDAA